MANHVTNLTPLILHAIDAPLPPDPEERDERLDRMWAIHRALATGRRSGRRAMHIAASGGRQ